MRTQGKVFNERVLEKDEFCIRLKEKLIEEAQEVFQAHSKIELTEELADILEVVYTLAEENQINLIELENIRKKKCQTKGGFKERRYCSFPKL